MDDFVRDEYNERITKCFRNIMTVLNTEDKAFTSWRNEAVNALLKTKKEYEEFQREMEMLNDKYDDVQLKNDQMCKTLEEKNLKLESNKAEIKKLDSKYDSLLKKLEKLDQECIKTEKQTELSTVDKNVLDLSRKKLQIYGQMTNIIWDYSTPLTAATVTGYIRNEDKNYLNAFEFKKSELSFHDLKEKIWKEIELGSGEDWSDIIAMTKLSSNK